MTGIYNIIALSLIIDKVLIGESQIEVQIAGQINLIVHVFRYDKIYTPY